MTQPQRVDLTAIDTTGDGVHWSLAMPSELNVNLVALEAAHAIGEHVNSEVDVVFVVLGGEGRATVDAVVHDLRRDVVLHVRRGLARSVVAGDTGLRYLSIHRARGALGIGITRP